MATVVLRHGTSPTDGSWVFSNVAIPPTNRPGYGKHISVTSDNISLSVIQFPQNRIIQGDDPSKFILVSFAQLRFKPEQLSQVEMGSAAATREYEIRLFREGLVLNGVQYRFYGHSNSQLRSRSCFLREARNDEELDRKIYSFGDFQKIMNVAKRAKRIGLLFSEAKIDWILEPKWTADIEDIVVNGENFSDGCGLISRKFAIQLSRHKRIIFRGKPYTPTVFQIRGYKGVLMLSLDLQPEHAHFRKSQKKFTATQNNTFSVVGHSVPYAFARLNNDVVVLLASLGITTEKFVEKQRAYHRWVRDTSTEWQAAFDFLSALGRIELAERLLLEGIDSDAIQKAIRGLQKSEVANFRKNEGGRFRVRTLIPKSRFLFGVCDPYGVLREGEVHVRVMLPREGATTLTNVDVLVVRNPCLHPGDCVKLRAVNHPRLSHLVDCIVFATKGRRAAPSMMSGGDLDGDQFTIIWDPDLVPSTVAESYTYPASREHVNTNITRQDLAKHFASYNSMSLARIVALHSRWARYSSKGAMCDECQELNALHSSVVDGASTRIPSRLENIPKKEGDEEEYVLDALHREAQDFADDFLSNDASASGLAMVDHETAEQFLIALLTTEKMTLSEYEVFVQAVAISRLHHIDLVRYTSHIDFSAMSIAEKHAASATLDLTPEQAPYIWNSLVRSDILQPRDLESRDLGGPLRVQRLYTSSIQGRAGFFEYLKEAIEDYNRRLVILRTDERFSVGIFMRGPITWNDEPPVDNNVLVCFFMPRAMTVSSTYKRSTKGYKLHCSDSRMELYNQQRGDTFIFITRPPPRSGADIITSIALQKISSHVMRQCGRVNRTPVVSLEIHVVSNRDRIGHQAFDLRFEHVQTEEVLRRFDHRPHSFIPSSLQSVIWSERSPEEQVIFQGSRDQAELVLRDSSEDDLMEYMQFAVEHRAEEHVFWIFDALLSHPEPIAEALSQCMDQYPPLAFSVLKKHLTDDHVVLPEWLNHSVPSLIRNIIRSSNQLGIASLVALEKVSVNLSALDLSHYISLLWTAALTVRSPELVQEVFLVMHESHIARHVNDMTYVYAHKQALGVVFDRAEEAADACPCDEFGRPRRQRTKPTRGRLHLPKASNDEADHGTKTLGGSPALVVADIRVDAPTPIRIHSHIRLQVASSPEHSTLPPSVVDAIVVRASKGELFLTLQQPLPPEYAEVDWKLYSAGSIATSKAMLDAVQKLAMEGWESCRFHKIITGTETPELNGISSQTIQDTHSSEISDIPASLNRSQRRAVISASTETMSLIWGPPGTGKTTVVVQILLRFLRRNPDVRILMTASTHNAVDNVLERFVAENEANHLLEDEQILRAATESSRVNKALQKYTIDARLGGSINEDPRLLQKAERRVKQARIVFTTCSGAGLGIIRNIDFDTVLIDEASQITEPVALIPLVKGCKTAVLVGDHEQLRPTVRPMGKALEFDKSLFERLYTGPLYPMMSRTMLDVQYRFSAEVARFCSDEFYNGDLQTGNSRHDDIRNILEPSSFPWPTRNDRIFPVVFVPCSSEEDHGRSSKSNNGQANLVKYIIHLLRTSREDGQAVPSLHDMSVAALTPYSRQVKLLSEILPASVVVSTIDGFQGRESDVVVFSTVRCNMEGDIGFVEDNRRLNVAWTRPKLALIIVGDRRTLSSNPLWTRALNACEEVNIPLPEVVTT
ncbi:unnamed protein product [Somion occarium]|uniref:AAA+ ATPase domain-containing protein n=1 Tax=Somion occarium TaxID=3059160 RepID=A0ABP1DXQ3_9APHY